MADAAVGSSIKQGFDYLSRAVDDFNNYRNETDTSKACQDQLRAKIRSTNNHVIKFRGDPIEYHETSVNEFTEAIKDSKEVLAAEEADVEAHEERGRWRFAVTPGSRAKREGSNSRVRAAIDKLNELQLSHNRNVESRVRREARDARDAAKDDPKTSSKTVRRSSSARSHRSDKHTDRGQKPHLRSRRHSVGDSAQGDDKKMAKKSKKSLPLPAETGAGSGDDGARGRKSRRHDRDDHRDVVRMILTDKKAGKRDASLGKPSTKARSRSRDAHQNHRPPTPSGHPKTRHAADIKRTDTNRTNRTQDQQRVPTGKTRTIQQPDKHARPKGTKQDKNDVQGSLAKRDPCYRRYP